MILNKNTFKIIGIICCIVFAQKCWTKPLQQTNSAETIVESVQKAEPEKPVQPAPAETSNDEPAKVETPTESKETESKPALQE